MQRAASCTVDVGCSVFTFINRPNTDWIDYIRFDESDPTGTERNKAETGKVGVKGGQYIQAISGPMSCVKCYNPQKKTTDIRLYFVIAGALREAKLVDAGSTSDLKGGWVLMQEDGPDDMLSVTSANGLDRNTRLVDQTSYMSSGKTSGKGPEHQLPYVVYQVLNEPNVIRYAWAMGTGDQIRWKNDRLPVRLLPAK